MSEARQPVRPKINFCPMRVAALISAALLTGCAIDPGRVAASPDATVCMGYGQFRQSGAWSGSAETARKELESRRIFSDAEWRAVNSQSLYIGMGTCAMHAVMGLPSRENRIVNSSGVSTQYVYRMGRHYSSPMYVYTQDGRVTGWQN